MPHKGGGSRATRLGDQIQRDLSEIIRLELKDPRIGFVTLTGVELSPDLTHAKVFFTVLGDVEALDETRSTLRRASGFLRSRLAHSMTTRVTPELHFEYDESVSRGARVSRLIDEAVRDDAVPESDPDSDSR
ncbi:MAG: 30S ribosome-binding factor RbfA [Betaproteobacteria bacterium]|nr:30S ribosome-binding factor RbfA [Betaproteobacteria bacterium]